MWVLLVPGVANMTPPMVAKWWPKWDTPLDMRISWNGKRLFGDHKTVRGLVCGVAAAEVLFLILGIPLPWYFGGLLGLGALGGDAIKSFFKRQMGILSGKSWFPWDQIDWILGVLLVCQIINLLNILEIIILITIGLILHLISKWLGYLFGLNKTII